MKAFLLALFVSCAPLMPNLDRVAIAHRVTNDPAEVAYLVNLPVLFVGGSPECGGLASPSQVYTGCFYPADGHIEVATIDFSKSGDRAWRYDSEMASTLAHEYGHALQLYRHLPVGHPLPPRP